MILIVQRPFVSGDYGTEIVTQVKIIGRFHDFYLRMQ